MSRWQPNARERLERAALELYTERGFDQTTVDDIAARAGLTERTFFRHFADKREVLFFGQEALIDTITKGVAAEPDTVSAFDAVAAGFAATASFFDARRDSARQRQRIIDANRSLQERELSKLAILAHALAETLRDRGIDQAAARLTAETGLAVFKVAFQRWIADRRAPRFGEILDNAFTELKTLATGRG
ncbi:TetR family transcriptional regulator [Mycolicibacterium iranicum]|uniref:TetR family transcriptional regulator n=1 Tax=Mycolicibacterium iranicum TaxID=912594 RepID=A0A178M2M8_MYCIR|nr:TetR family transcriptional regulator [Mycolicibacterium iranicum]OAN40676.1 TetR family transcriptional regulator [Mycolicibacterium iranicum]